MKPRFAIGTLATINGEDWRVVRYHKIGNRWEVMFCSLKSGEHMSIPTKTLEIQTK